MIRRPDIAVFSLVMLGAAILSPPRVAAARPAVPAPRSSIVRVDMHAADMKEEETAKPLTPVVPSVARPGSDGSLVGTQVLVPPVPPGQQGEGHDILSDPGKSGTGFFVSADGTVLTAANVTEGCQRMQIISNAVPRTWVSVAASDPTHDLALLRAPGLRAPAVLRISASAPAGDKLRIPGFPATEALTAPAEAAAVTINSRFPSSVGSLANTRDTMWISAPTATRGYSGAPIFDPKLGAVVGMVRGVVNGGFLRLVRELPTTGVLIGPGVGAIGPFLRREGSNSALSLASAPVDTSEETLRRATVHVLCWR